MGSWCRIVNTFFTESPLQQVSVIPNEEIFPKLVVGFLCQLHISALFLIDWNWFDFSSIICSDITKTCSSSLSEIKIGEKCLKSDYWLKVGLSINKMLKSLMFWWEWHGSISM